MDYLSTSSLPWALATVRCGLSLVKTGANTPQQQRRLHGEASPTTPPSQQGNPFDNVINPKIRVNQNLPQGKVNSDKYPPPRGGGAAGAGGVGGGAGGGRGGASFQDTVEGHRGPISGPRDIRRASSTRNMSVAELV